MTPCYASRKLLFNIRNIFRVVWLRIHPKLDISSNAKFILFFRILHNELRPSLEEGGDRSTVAIVASVSAQLLGENSL